MPNWTQLDLVTWLVQKDRPLQDRLSTLKSNPAGKNTPSLIAEVSHERGIIAALCDMVRASTLPKHEPGLIGRPRPPVAAEEDRPAETLDDVMTEQIDEKALAAALEDKRRADAIMERTQPIQRPAQIEAILMTGREKMQAQAQKMREAKARKAAERAAQEGQPA